MIRDFDKRFSDLIDESVPRVMLTSKEENREERCAKRKQMTKNNSEFVKNYCEEY